jgi:predicted patatin/cPLA2 family phospholipase
LFPAVIPDPPPGTFELGLVLGGTVSAGAYTAGALDFLLQALEAELVQPVRGSARRDGHRICLSR